MKGRQRGRVSLPETAARAADIPVGHLVDEACDAGADGLRVEVLHRDRDIAGELVDVGEQPPVEQRTVRDGRSLDGGRPALGVGVEDVERDGVPVGQEHLADDLGQRGVADPSRRPR